MATKKLHFLDRFIFFINAVLAFLLLLSYALPFISPRFLPFFSILNFGIPVLILLNIIFLLYWVLKLKKQFLLSGIVLILGYSHITSLYVFADKKNEATDGFKIMSYNVRHFNLHRWIENVDVVQEIEQFIEQENPDFIAFQDFKADSDFNIEANYPNHYIYFKGSDKNLTTAFYSKYPIINKKNIAFPNTGNGALFVDVKLPNDTLRVFNIHLESLKIKPDVKELKNEDRKKLVNRVGQSFKKQAEQVDLIQPYIENSPYKNIIIGDFNNTAFSFVYRKLKNNNLKDAFKEKGRGFGKTFDFDFIPIRIDHALVDQEIEVIDFNNYEVQLSDHYPIMLEFTLPDN